MDATAAYRCLAGQGFTETALAGDSAGHGLALVVLAAAVAEAKNGSGLRTQAAAVMSPWTDLTLSGASLETRAEADPVLTRGVITDAAHLYLGSHDASDSLVSPLAGDLADLPPIRLHVGEDEVLLDDARRYADKADKREGSEAHVWEGMPHVFPASLGILAAAAVALDDIGNFLRLSLHSRKGPVR